VILPARRRPLHIILAASTVLCAAALVFSAIRTYQELHAQRAVFLRSRVAALAAHLETIPPSVPESQWQQILAEEEDALTGLAILDRPSSPAALAPLWDGRELFRTESLSAPVPTLRAYVPFHHGPGIHIARIDIAESAADFLVEHARHHLWFVALGGLLIVGLTVLTVRNADRAALAERRQLKLQHLATLGEMSASLAHEIRNPLGTIKGFAQLLAEKLNGAHAALVTPILSETTRLEDLVKDLLLYGRPTLPNFQSVHTTNIEATLRQHAQHLIDSPTLHFETTVHPFSLDTDPQLLEQLLLNLLRNAIDAVRPQPAGHVNLEITATAECAILRILDNGPGLSEEARRRLFEPFYTSKASGTGLGLSISRKLAESLGGHLTLDPRPTGGLSAEILLPLHRNA
jgi:signal transduction histidine kinase